MTPSPVAERRWLIGGTVAAGLVLVFGSAQTASWLGHETEIVTDEISAVGVEVIEVDSPYDSPDGGVQVVGADVEVITVRAEVSHGFRRTRLHQDLDDGRLVLRASCPRVLTDWCAVDYEIEVPHSMAAELSNRHGVLEVTGLDGPVVLHSRNGDTIAHDLDGPVRVDSRHGSIEATELGSAIVEVSTNNGSVLLSFSEPPDLVDIYSNNGSVDVEVPNDSSAYAVEVTTNNGATTSAVQIDPASDHTITARSNHGDVAVRYGDD